LPPELLAPPESEPATDRTTEPAPPPPMSGDPPTSAEPSTKSSKKGTGTLLLPPR
jgi:hypothetical protein